MADPARDDPTPEQPRDVGEPPREGDAEAAAIATDAQEQAEAALDELMEGEFDAAQMAPHMAELEPADAADRLEDLDPDEQSELVHLLEDRDAADALAHMEVPLAVSVISDLPPKEAAALIGLMEPDDAADLLQELDVAERQKLIKHLHPKQAAVLGKLALYDPESAGGIMTTRIAVVREGMRIGQAIEFLKTHSLDSAQTELFVVDELKRLKGLIGLRDLLVIDDEEPLADHLDSDYDAVTTEIDREEVARLFERYDLLTLPVVDEEGRVLGMVTIDDVVDIISAEATEDAYKQVGAGQGEAVYSRVVDKLKGRGPWLVINLLMAQAGSAVILFYTDLIELLPVVAVIYPVIANQSGNSGQQSLAITLRGIVLGEVRPERVWPLVRRELVFGVVVGIVIGVLFAVGAALLGPLVVSDPASEGRALSWGVFGLVCGGAMALAMVVGVMIGTATPMILQRLGADPATASALFVTMLTDAISYALFLGFVLLAQPYLLPV